MKGHDSNPADSRGRESVTRAPGGGPVIAYFGARMGSESQSPGDIQASGGFFLFERSFLVLARRAGLGRRIAYACMLKAWFQTRWRAGTGGGKRFFEKSSLALAGTRYNVGGTCSKCTFLPRAEKEQFDYAEGIIKFKRVAPERANLRFAPSGLPHSRGDGLRERNPPP